MSLMLKELKLMMLNNPNIWEIVGLFQPYQSFLVMKNIYKEISSSVQRLFNKLMIQKFKE